jgi:CubicO group peptidase (beta-lactamase class C family)
MAELEEGGPGVAVAVVKDGSVLHRKGYGMADLEWGAAIEPDTVLALGSLTKPITAMSVLLLEKQGKLSIDDPITAYLPDYPTHGHTITIAHLLTHTSGIPNYVTMPDFFPNETRKDLSPDELSKLFRDLPLDFAPGTAYAYSNSGYVLLGMIIEALSGLSYGDFVEQNVFAPLGMAHSRYMHDKAIIPRRARGYERVDNSYENATYTSSTVTYSAGGLGSTLDDLILMDRALREYRLLDRPTLERSYNLTRLLDGRLEYYGLGWALNDYRQHRVVHHAGGIPGFSCFYGRFMQEQLSIIVLSNIGDFRAGRLARGIGDLLLDIPLLEREPVQVGEDVRRKLAGTYSGFLGFDTITVKDDGRDLALSGFMERSLLPAGDTSWYAADDPDFEVEFDDSTGEGYNRMLVRYPFNWVELTRRHGRPPD